ncbi:MAG: glycosyltransferase family 4 protein, partial [Pirellulaceae bacterium]|nr:glycosyltransferase family 4 protein [Pirellulaceae bacterium]
MPSYPTIMKILLCHNFYQQPGGEDKVFADEGALLELHGHQVVRYERHNDDVGSMGRMELLKKTIWNDRTWQEIGTILERERPEVMHCTNTFPLISPSVYYRAKSLGVSVVQSLHNYRIVCPKAQLMRQGQVCEKCLGKRIAWPALTHRCYRDSLPATAVIVSMLAHHWKKGTWLNAVDQYIALTEFAKQKLVEGGLPKDKIRVKPNFIKSDPGVGQGKGDYAIFVGRLSPEKGITTLLTAWRKLKSNLKLKILGDGPLAQQVATAALEDPRIEWLGHQTMDQVNELIGEARF